MKALVLSSSPRRNGNSALLAEAVSRGWAKPDMKPTCVFADDFLPPFCATADMPEAGRRMRDRGRLSRMFLDRYLPADGFIAATPIYWYGTSAQLKAFFDRTFCYYAASYPGSEDVIKGMTGKRIGLVLSSEETFPMVSGGVLSQIQEFSRYTHSTFVGVVHGYGNARGDVLRDPGEPIKAARRFGQEFFTRHATDYQIDTVRPGRVWG